MFSISARRWLWLPALGSAALTGLLLVSATASAAPQWRIVDLGLSSYSQAHAINSKGHVVGHDGGRAFLWRQGRITHLTPSEDSGVATDINNRDEVVGYHSSAGGARVAFLWRDGVMTDLGVLPGAYDSGADAINDAGDVVGWSGGRAFRWREGIMTDLGALPDAGYAVARDVNAAGVIVGSSRGFTTPGVAVRWRSGGIQPLISVPGTSSDAMAINNRGQVAGSYYAGGSRGFLWYRGRFSDITPPPGYTAVQPHAINNRGQVVGLTANSVSQAFVWQQGRMTLLPALTGNGNAAAHDINDRGQVVGFAVQDPSGPVPNYNAVLWTR